MAALGVTNRKGRKESGAGRMFIVGGNWKCATDPAKVSLLASMSVFVKWRQSYRTHIVLPLYSVTTPQGR